MDALQKHRQHLNELVCTFTEKCEGQVDGALPLMFIFEARLKSVLKTVWPLLALHL